MTREVFGNIPLWAKTLFYLLAVVSVVVLAYGIRRRGKLWSIGQPAPERWKLRDVARNLWRDVLLQSRVRGRGLASFAHICLFSGFVVLLLATTLIGIEHVLAEILGRDKSDPVFHKGVYYAIYEVVSDAFGLVFLLGVVLLAIRRRWRPASLDHNRADWIVLGCLLVIGVTGYAVEGLRIIREETDLPGFSFVGWGAAQLWSAVGVDAQRVANWHFVLWWFHAVCALGLIAAIPYTRLLHFVAGSLNLATRPLALGRMQPVTIEELEERGQIGAGALEDFSRRQLLMMDACVSCGRCEEACPAFAASAPLSPKAIVQDARGLLTDTAAVILSGRSYPSDNGGTPIRQLHGETISAEALWSCTACVACVEVCPLGISPLGMITDMRRYLVGEASLRGSAATALQKLSRSGNPWGLPPEERMQWSAGLKVPTVHDCPDFDVLYWVGCAAAYDRRTQQVARAIVQLLQAAHVKFAVLGNEERCTGEAARRVGDEFLFQELADANIKTLTQHGVRKILTHCPHCLNSFQQDYVQFGAEFEVVHHTEFLADLVARGCLPGLSGETAGSDRRVTYHDPCYLARVSGITQPPRDLIQSAAGPAGEHLEMPRRGRHTACCGGGGGRMWMDDTTDERIGGDRVREAVATGADTVAVGCPFCLKMLSDGVAAEAPSVAVKDVAELLLARCTP